jgi:hypothetical protein
MAFSGLARQSLERPTYGELKPQLLGAQLLQVHPAYSVPRNKLHSEGYKKIFPKMSLCDSGCTNLFIESLSLWSKPQKKDLVQSLVSPVSSAYQPATLEQAMHNKAAGLVAVTPSIIFE